MYTLFPPFYRCHVVVSVFDRRWCTDWGGGDRGRLIDRAAETSAPTRLQM